MDASISDDNLRREAIELYGERYPDMSPNEWRHVVEAYTPMVREAANPKDKEISMQQYGKAADRENEE
jgi:type I restriction enzyme R subunit